MQNICLVLPCLSSAFWKTRKVHQKLLRSGDCNVKDKKGRVKRGLEWKCGLTWPRSMGKMAQLGVENQFARAMIRLDHHLHCFGNLFWLPHYCLQPEPEDRKSRCVRLMPVHNRKDNCHRANHPRRNREKDGLSSFQMEWRDLKCEELYFREDQYLHFIQLFPGWLLVNIAW